MGCKCHKIFIDAIYLFISTCTCHLGPSDLPISRQAILKYSGLTRVGEVGELPTLRKFGGKFWKWERRKRGKEREKEEEKEKRGKERENGEEKKGNCKGEDDILKKWKGKGI